MVDSCFQHSDSQTEHTCSAAKIFGLFSQDCTSQSILVMHLTEDKSLKSASSLSCFVCFNWGTVSFEHPRWTSSKREQWKDRAELKV